MGKLEDKYGVLPEVPEHVVEEVMREVNAFGELMKHDPDAARKSVMDDIEWLKEKKDFLGEAVVAAVDPALELYDEQLSHRDWVDLETFLLKGVLLLLEAINRAMKESQSVIFPKRY